MSRLMVTRVTKNAQALVRSALASIGFIDDGARGDWMVWRLRYMNTIVTAWANKQGQYKIQFEILETE